MICPVLSAGPSQTDWVKCREGECAWWDGAACAVKTLATGIPTVEAVAIAMENIAETVLRGLPRR